jgi:hypothetical protein
MSGRDRSAFSAKFLPVVAAAVALAGAAPALAVDPVFDPMGPNQGLTATAPRQAERETRRDLDRTPSTPTLTERFGLPPVSGPLQPILPPVRQEPVFQQDRGPAAVPPPPRPLRARQRPDRDG